MSNLQGYLGSQITKRETVKRFMMRDNEYSDIILFMPTYFGSNAIEINRITSAPNWCQIQPQTSKGASPLAYV